MANHEAGNPLVSTFCCVVLLIIYPRRFKIKPCGIKIYARFKKEKETLAVKITWAFVDYENIHSLKAIDLSRYAKVVLFLGSQQSTIDIGSAKYLYPVTFEIVSLANASPNNLDFHLAYYLGRYDVSCDSSIAFEVITNDKGFSNLLAYLCARGRVCRQVSLQDSDPYQKIVSLLTNKSLQNKPKKLESLRNFLGSQMQCQGNELAIQGGIKHLLKCKVIEIENNQVKYV